jgi:hypothetical protein
VGLKLEIPPQRRLLGICKNEVWNKVSTD